MPPPVPPSVNAGPDDRGQPDDAQRLVDAGLALLVRGPLDDHRWRIGLADAVEQVPETLPVLGHLDGLDGGAQQPGAVLLQQTGMRHVHGQVERRLAAEPGEDALGPLALQDALHGGHGQRLEIDRIRDARIGHDRGRVGVEQDGPDALLAEGATGLGAGVVELGGLADDDRPGADDEHRGGLRRRLPARQGDAHLAHPAAPIAGQEPVEHLHRIERAGRSFRVVLHGLDGQRVVAQPLDAAVVQVALADREPGASRQRVRRRPSPRGSGP